MKGYMNKMDEALGQMADLITQSAQMDVDELKERLSAWHKRWMDGDELPGLMKLGLMSAFVATFGAVMSGHTSVQMHRDPDQIARDGGSWHHGRQR